MKDYMLLERVQKRMKQMLDESGIKPHELAKLTGLQKPSISQYCNGKNVPSKVSANKIRDAVYKKTGKTYETEWIQGISGSTMDGLRKQKSLLSYYEKLTPAQQDGLINMAKILCDMNSK